MTVYTYSQDRRHDPDTRDRCAAVSKAQREALVKAAKDLQKIVEDLRFLNGVPGTAIFERSAYAIRSAASSVQSDADFMDRPDNDTYIGNCAAGPMGEYLENIDMEHRFQGKV